MNRTLYHLRFRYYALKDVISDEIHIEGEAVSARITDRGIIYNHAVLSAHRISDSAGEALRKDLTIRQHDPALPIHIVLRVGHLLTQLEALPVCVLDRNLIRLVATGPNDKISPVHILGLFSRSSRLNQLHALLLPSHNSQIEILRIASQATK